MHAHVSGGEAERERGRRRIPSRLHAVSTEPDAHLKPTNGEIMTWAKTKHQVLNWLSHPGTPSLSFFLFLCSFTLFLKFHIWLKSYGICLYLTDLSHLALYSQTPSMLLQMARFHLYLCLKNILLHIYIYTHTHTHTHTHRHIYICIPSLLYPFIYWWTLRLLP